MNYDLNSLEESPIGKDIDQALSEGETIGDKTNN